MTASMGRRNARKEYERRINKAIDFITSHLVENPSLDEIAEAASFSKFHFHRLFQAHVGESVTEFTRRLRLEKSAAQLHFDRTKDITSIALDCGFSSSQNFAKAFKKHFAMSPTEYRETNEYSKGPVSKRSDSKNGNTIRKDGNAASKPGNADVGPGSHSHDDTDHVVLTERESIMTTSNIEVKDVPDRNVAYVRVIGEYGFEPATKAFQSLEKWAGPRGFLESGQLIGIPWDNPCITPAEKCRYDACVTVPKGAEITGGADHQVVSGGRYAVNHTEVIGNDFQKGWDELIGEWLPSSGYQPGDGPAYEIYKWIGDDDAGQNIGTDDPEVRWQVDIYLPVKPL